MLTINDVLGNIYHIPFYRYLINNPRMFNGAIFDLAEKPYIPQKILLQ